MLEDLLSGDNMNLEWAQLTATTVVVANANRAWLHELDPFQVDDPFAQPMEGPGSFETTQQLLDAAVAAAQKAARPDDERPPLTPLRYAWQVIGHYHTMHPTVGLMREAAERFWALGRRDLAEFAEQTAFQEKGHDRLAILDLEELGFDGEAIVAALCPSAAARLVKYFTRCIRTPEPLEAFGFMYGGERTCVSIGRDYVERLQAMLPPSVHATRTLRVHSGIGVEVEHVADSLQVIAQLSASERTRIARAAYERTVVTFTPPEDGYPQESEVEEMMLKFSRNCQLTKEN